MEEEKQGAPEKSNAATPETKTEPVAATEPFQQNAEMQKTPEGDFIDEKLRLYYEINLEAPNKIARREFGFGFQKKIDIRHKAFANLQELSRFISTYSPRFISYSSAIYNFPAARPIERKERLGVELIFDLDGSPRNEKCGHKKSAGTLFCKKCLENVRQDAITLKEDFLISEFGFKKEEIWQKFSGSKGFHIHIQNEKAMELSSNARRELAFYISASELGAQNFLKREEIAKRKFKYSGPDSTSKGWKGRLHREMKRLLLASDFSQMKRFISKRDAENISKNPVHYINELDNGNWGIFSKPESTIQKFVDRKKKEIGIEVDASVTFDLHRLIRLENSIHGDTGFVAKKIEDNLFPEFDPTIHALPFKKGETTIIPNDEIKIEFQNQSFRLEGGKRTEVPTNLALLILCKKRGKLA